MLVFTNQTVKGLHELTDLSRFSVKVKPLKNNNIFLLCYRDSNKTSRHFRLFLQHQKLAVSPLTLEDKLTEWHASQSADSGWLNSLNNYHTEAQSCQVSLTAKKRRSPPDSHTNIFTVQYSSCPEGVMVSTSHYAESTITVNKEQMEGSFAKRYVRFYIFALVIFLMSIIANIN